MCFVGRRRDYVCRPFSWLTTGLSQVFTILALQGLFIIKIIQAVYPLKRIFHIDLKLVAKIAKPCIGLHKNMSKKLKFMTCL